MWKCPFYSRLSLSSYTTYNQTPLFIIWITISKNQTNSFLYLHSHVHLLRLYLSISCAQSLPQLWSLSSSATLQHPKGHHCHYQCLSFLSALPLSLSLLPLHPAYMQTQQHKFSPSMRLNYRLSRTPTIGPNKGHQHHHVNTQHVIYHQEKEICDLQKDKQWRQYHTQKKS